MEKRNLLWLILDLVFLVIFNAVFFILGGIEHSVAVWISYGFIHFSYIMLLLTPRLIRKSSSSAVLGFSIYSISSIYFVVAFFVGLFFVFYQNDSYKACIVTHLIIAGLYISVLVSNLLANESTADNIERHETELKFVKESASRLKNLASMITDKTLLKQVDKAYDLIHSSQSKSNQSVRSLEQEVFELIDMLEVSVSSNKIDTANSTVKKILKIAEERNQKLRNSN